MRKTLAVAALVVCACEAQVQADAEGLRLALPDEAAIRIDGPASPPSPEATAREVVAAAPEFGSAYAAATFWSAATVNCGVAWGLERLRLVASLAPTSCDAVACTWGPWTDREGLNVWRLVASHQASGYAYALEARPVSGPAAPFAPIVAGVAYAGAAPGRGHGVIQVDFEAAATALAHAPGWAQEDFGRVEVEYDARQGLRVYATARGARSRDPENPALIDAVYAFRSAGAEEGGGELQVALKTLAATELRPAGWTFSLRSRWDASGAGRGDALSPDVPQGASECWAAAAEGFALLYDSDGALPGSESACAFSPASPATLALP